MPTPARIDWLIATAANPAQARGYEAQLRAREAAGRLTGVGRWRVIADPGGRRVGSGGSTLWVLAEVARELASEAAATKDSGGRGLGALFRGRRVVIVHSGGDSRRLAAYAAQGKVFTPLPCPAPDAPADASQTSGGSGASGGSGSQIATTLFDLILARLAALPAPGDERGQVLVAAGDVLLTFPPEAVDFDRPGVVGVAFPAGLDRGARHGVYVADDAGRVVDFLQKPDPDTARKRRALDRVGRVLVDTGLVSLDPATAEQWLTAAGVRRRGTAVEISRGLLRDLLNGVCPAIDLYEHVLMAIPPRLDRAAYLSAMGASHTGRSDAAAHRRRLASLHRGLHGSAMHVCVLPYCDFFHVGSNRELLHNVATLSRTSEAYRFRNFDGSWIADRAAVEGAFVYNALLTGPQVRLGRGSLIEAVHSDSRLQLAGPNLLVGLPAGAGDVALPEGWGLVCVPVSAGRGRDTWAAVVFGLDDDFKTPIDRGGTFGNRPAEQVLRERGVSPAAVWDRDDAERTLWTARLWPIGPIDQAVARAMQWVTGGEVTGWRRGRRVSMAELLPIVDHPRLLAHRREVHRRVSLMQLPARLARDPWVSAATVLSLVTTAEEARVARAGVASLVRRERSALGRARLHTLASSLASRWPGDGGDDAEAAAAAADERRAFEAVADSVAAEAAPPPSEPRAAILADQVVWVTTPVRIDLAGGWSDTPPICAELGGTVLNVAITLNGQYPVQVIAKRVANPAITLTSIDLGERLRFASRRDLRTGIDPRRWSALPLTALRLSGLLPASPTGSLRRHLERFGGGLDITLFSALPKGSGMGTSSVLGAAMLGCLARVVGERLSREDLIARTSLLEQVMTTGGGWQDQIGGVVPGAKLIRTRPGPDQTPTLHAIPLDLSPTSDLGPRTLLYFTGIQRMARDILQKVVRRYLERDPQVLRIIDALKDGAEEMKHSIETRDWPAVCRGLGDYWALKRRIDPGSTSPEIERLVQPVERYLEARLLPGAGGGGFVLMVAHDPDAAARVRAMMTANPRNRLARFFDFAVDDKGLATTLL